MYHLAVATGGAVTTSFPAPMLQCPLMTFVEPQLEPYLNTGINDRQVR